MYPYKYLNRILNTSFFKIVQTAQATKEAKWATTFKEQNDSFK